MRFNPACPLVWHKIGNRLSIATDDDGFAVRFQSGQQAGKVGFRFVNIHCLHVAEKLVQLVHRVNCESGLRVPANPPTAIQSFSRQPLFPRDDFSRGALAFLAGQKSETLSQRRPYSIGEKAKEEIVTPRKIAVVDPIATEVRRQTEAAKIPVVFFFFKKI
jgi:hypothetical protein